MFRELSREDFLKLTESLEETRRIEVKPPFNWSSEKEEDIYQRERFIRGVIALSNNPGGGRLFVGIEEKISGDFDYCGLTEEQYKSFPSSEEITKCFDSFVTEKVFFIVKHHRSKETEINEKHFLIFEIEEFDEIPNLCRKSGKIKRILTKGSLYCRTIKSPYSSNVVDRREFSEMIEISVGKKITKIENMGFSKASGSREQSDKIIKELGL